MRESNEEGRDSDILLQNHLGAKYCSFTRLFTQFSSLYLLGARDGEKQAFCTLPG